MFSKWRRHFWILAVAIVFVGALVALNWQGLALSLAIISAEHRPALLNDARWNDPASAHLFAARFRHGTQEKDLLEWLAANKFTVDRTGLATRRIQSLPCNESVEVTWSKAGDTIVDAEARVSEAGCL